MMIKLGKFWVSQQGYEFAEFVLSPVLESPDFCHNIRAGTVALTYSYVSS